MGTHELPRHRRALIVVALALGSLARAAEETAPPEPEAAPAAETPVPPNEVKSPEAPPNEAKPPEAPPNEAAAADVVAKKANLSFVPIPEIILDPNEGNTYGLLGVVLFKDDNDEIQYMFAPDVQYNSTKGVFPNLRLFGYPSPTERYSILIGKSTTRDENYEVEYTNRGLWDGRAFFLVHALYERDSTERFYGFGNDTKESGESNYTDQDFYADATPGVWVLPYLNVAYRMRIRRFEVQPGQVSSLPFIATEHPEVREKGGLEPAVYWQHRLSVAYDTRDSIDMPTGGAFANAYVDGSSATLGSHTSFTAFGFEWRDFVPFRGALRNPVLAMRAFVDYLQGPTDTPFYLQNNLGGRRALRGFGGDRFTDFNRSLMSAELRTRVYERRLFGVKAEVEIAPFVEAGQVFRHIYDPPVDDLHVVGGVGFRALVRPQVVAFVDVGYGPEGSKIFTGIDYPF
jgi:hypothetical protein